MTKVFSMEALASSVADANFACGVLLVVEGGGGTEGAVGVYGEEVVVEGGNVGVGDEGDGGVVGVGVGDEEASDEEPAGRFSAMAW